MKKYKKLFIRLIPIVFIMVLTISLSELFYRNMIGSTTEKCWEDLSTARSEVTREVSISLTANLKMLDLAADAIVMNADLEDEETVLDYLEEVQEKTIFNRIDVVYPNGMVLVQTGDHVKDNGEKTYEELVEKGSHISQRVYDFHTGKETLHVFSPVYDKKDRPIAVLRAAVFCSTLAEVFNNTYFGGRCTAVSFRSARWKFCVG